MADVIRYRGRYFDEFEVGQVFEGMSVTVTESHIDSFGSITHGWAGVHVNEEYAKTRPFGRRMAHGMPTASLVVSGRQPYIYRTAAGHLGEQFTFRALVFIDDTIHGTVEVIEKTAKSRWGIVHFRHLAKKTTGEVVLEAESLLAMVYPPK